ncbi:MAG TPA: hypothetical protein VGG04_14930 [Candidatus Sulfotelmatobacter sp.]|jgi:hypothetical protein
MEGLTRLVTESLARHGFDRPLDYRRLQWSRWFRCDSPHSLLCVPSKPGVFAIAEEITPAETTRRMLGVTQFLEADDMAFVLDRILSRPNPMRANFETGRYFVRFVTIEDEAQRRSVASALNQWMLSTSEKVTDIGSHFASSLELTPATEYVPQANDAQGTLFATGVGNAHVATAASAVPQSEASGPPPFPSGF